MVRASIHQPQYIPWLGYFYKILHSEVFVLFDTVQYPRGKHFGNRNQVKTPQGAHWLTVPVRQRSELLTFREIPVDRTQSWAEKHWRTLEVAYARSPFFREFAPGLRHLYLEREWEQLTDLNQALLEFCMNALGVTARLVRASELGIEREGMDTGEYIFAILERVGANEYISGRGAGSQRYIQSQAFAERGIQLWYSEFAVPPYPQCWGDFIPDLSVLDVLFNCGAQARSMLASGGRLERAR